MIYLNRIKNIGIVNIFTVVFIMTLGHSAYGDIVVELDSPAYSTRDTIFIQGILDQKIEGYGDVLITITDSKGTEVLRTDVELTSGNDFYYRHDLLTTSWDVYGLYEIQIQYVHQIANTSFYYISSVESPLTHVQSNIQLDKEVYDWVDEIQIVVIAPSFNIDKDRIETLGSKNKRSIEIPEYYKQHRLEIPEYYKQQSFKITSSSSNVLDDYQLIETGKNSGIFHGIIHLTGKCGVDIDGDKRNCDVDEYDGIKGKTGTFGKYQGPFNGYLSVKDNHTIKFEFKNTEETVTHSTKVSWNKGKITTDPFLVFETKSEYFLDDPDMNVNPERRDKVYVHMGKKSDLISHTVDQDTTWLTYAKEIELYETDKNTGIFRGFVTVVTDEKDAEASIILKLIVMMKYSLNIPIAHFPLI